jgi:hypothetical protein
VRFQRQKAIGEFIADFYCAKASLIVELDGSGHYDPEQKIKDKIRTKHLEKLGIRVIRFSNRDVERNFYGVCTVIDNEVKHLFYDMVGMEAYVDGEQEFAGPTVRLISDEEYDNFINGRIPLSIIRRCSKKKGGVDVTFYFPKSLENLQQMKLILNK